MTIEKTTNNGESRDILISIVIVNYKVPYCLMEALCSLRLAEYYDCCEVIVIDNASGDRSREIVTEKFHEVQWIQLKTNIGFGKACNIGVEAARGKYLLLLNPDTAVSASTLANAVEFMESHPKAGLMGPKILNPDGTLQHSCRRSIPTPAVAFYYFFGLSYLFPKSKRFGRYHLTYMDEDEAAQVDVISGSFMFMRRELFNLISGFDRRFFMYGEDIDLCYRITQAGHEVWYYPEIKIVHQKGKSSAKRRIRSRIYFYEAMIIFSRKYRNLQDTFFPWWLMWAGIVFQGTVNIGTVAARSISAMLVDAVVINASLWAGLSHQFFMRGEPSIYAAKPILPLVSAHLLTTIGFVLMFLYNGVYNARLYSIKNTFFSGILSSALILSAVHFLTDFNLRGFGIGLGFSALAIIMWREALPLLVKGVKELLFASECALIIGHHEDARRYICSLDKRRRPRIKGVIGIGRDLEMPACINGYPVLGGIDELEGALAYTKADTLLIAASEPWYSDIINLLARYNSRKIAIRWETMK